MSSEEIIAKIEGLILDITRSLANNESPQLTLLSRAPSNTTKDCSNVRLGDHHVTRSMFQNQGASAIKFGKIVQVLGFIYKLVKNGEKITQRDAYYTLSGDFSSQSEFTRILEDVYLLLQVPRSSLGISAAPKGAIAGSVKLYQGNEEINCLLLGKSGHQLPGEVENMEVESLGARYILIVEKDAVFNTLCEQVIWGNIPCILLTGRGYPPLSIRALATKLEAKLKIPVLGLFDYNPHGLQIFMTYRFGSTKMGPEGVKYTCNIQWLGLHWYDIKDVDSKHFKPFTARDTKLCDSLLSQPFVNQNEKYYNEMVQMKRHKVKLELECIEDLKRHVCHKILKKLFFRDAEH